MSLARKHRLAAVIRRTAAPLALATLISQANSIIILLALTRVGTLDMVADYRLAISAVGIATIVALPGAATAVSRSTAAGHAVTASVSRRRVPWALAGAVCLAGAGALLVAADRRTTGFAILAAAVAFVPWSMAAINMTVVIK